MLGHRPARSQQQSRAPEDPAPNTSAGSPAPVRHDVAGRQEHSHRQGQRSRSQRIALASSATNWRRAVFDPAVRSAGLVAITPHNLRHTAASLAVSSGARVKSVQRMLGHASAAMTLDVYTGLFTDNLDDVADRLDQAFEGLGADQMRTVGPIPDVASLDYRHTSGR